MAFMNPPSTHRSAPKVFEEGRRARKKRAVFARLYDAALTLFEAQGYEAVSVASICDAAQVAKGTFFNHFPTKEHVLFEWYARATAKAETVQPSPGSLGNQLASVCWASLSAVIARPELWRAKLRLSSLHAELRAVEHGADARSRERFCSLIAAAQAKGEVRAEIDPEAAAGLFLAQLTGTVREWVNAEGGFDLAATVEARTRAFANLLAPGQVEH